MEITIKYNDSYRELCKIVSINEKRLHLQIIENLQEIGFLSEPELEAGKTIENIINEYQEYTLDQVVVAIFKSKKQLFNPEVKEFVSSLTVWGDSYDNPCVECGFEMESEEEGIGKKTWINYSCTNSQCENTNSNEPDWGHK